MRTLRYLSEISQIDADAFTKIAPYAVNGMFLYELAEADGSSTFDDHLELEAAGLIQLGGMGVTQTKTINDTGIATVVDREYVLLLYGVSGSQSVVTGYKLTKIGQEVLGIMDGRDSVESLTKYWTAMSNKDTFDRALIHRITSREAETINSVPVIALKGDDGIRDRME
jgi:hypothetical protein